MWNKHVPSIAIIHCLPEIQIQLGTQYFIWQPYPIAIAASTPSPSSTPNLLTPKVIYYSSYLFSASSRAEYKLCKGTSFYLLYSLKYL